MSGSDGFSSSGASSCAECWICPDDYPGPCSEYCLCWVPYPIPGGRAVSGAWAQACDARFSPDGEPGDGSDLIEAARLITDALWFTDPAQSCRAVEYAGAYLRAYRKTLPDQDRRIPDTEINATGGALLWIALQVVAMLARSGIGYHARHAEACLRKWWKEQQ